MPDKLARIEAARAWLRNAGLYVEDAESVLDELFGNHGLLQPWEHEAKLQADVVRAWEGMRARGIRAEEEQFDYQRRACSPPAWLRRRHGTTKVQAGVSDHEDEDGVSGDLRETHGEPPATS